MVHLRAHIDNNSSSGDYLLVWQEVKGEKLLLYGRLLSGDGKSVGDGFLIRSLSMDNENARAGLDTAYSATSNAYLVVWAEDADIWARSVSATGALGSPFKVYDTTTLAPASQPAVTHNSSSNRFLVTWQRVNYELPVVYQIQSRTTSTTGIIGTVVTLANRTTSLIAPAVAVAGNGQFLAVWQDRRNGNDDIYGQRLTASGGLTGGNFVIANSSSAETAPALAWHSSANAYLVVWQRDGNVWARPFLSTGTPLNPAFAVSTASGAAPATQPAVAPIPGASTFLVAWNQSGFDGDGRILGRAVTTTKPKDDIFPIAEEPLAVRGAPTLAAAGEGTHLLAWEDRRGGNVDVYARLVRQEVVVNTDIQYTYDPLYRLTTAAYSGHISADYSYTYDEAGNMTAYTEQVNGQTTSVSRTFNAANQLVSSSDEELGKSSFSYDQNGNLEMTLLADDTRLGYRYDQRNLLEHAFRQAGPHGPEIMQAEFVYDGNANRVQQIDYSGGQPVTITYTNDILGMTQVLLADDGTTTTANLFGLDLISQGDGRQTHFLLTDGLGSVRQELAGGDLQTTTTYEPYGNLLTQTGTSGTTYGFTGEQEDAATGLVYLRARYYNPSLKVFISRDPFPGIPTLPATQHGYSYAHNNSPNYTDPTGKCIFGGIDTLICGGVVIVLGVAAFTYYALAPNSPEINLNVSLPNPLESLAERYPTECTVAIVAVSEAEKLAGEYVQSLQEPHRKKEVPWWPRDNRPAYEIFYRFIPSTEALSVVAGQYGKLWVPPNKRSQENFMSQDFNYVDNLAMSTTAMQSTSMTVLRIFTKPGTFDYLTNPMNARLHTSVDRYWLVGKVNFDVTSYKTFHSGDGSNYLQLKMEKDVLTIGFFQANTHKLYFEHQIDYVEAVTVH